MVEAAVVVSCAEVDGGFRCDVLVGDDPNTTRHEVSVAQADLDRLAPPGTGAEAVVGAAFGYLLEREPREQILRRFDLDVIGRYFPGWQDAVRERMAR